MDVHQPYLYRYLSVAFSYPSEEMLQTLENSLGDLAQSVQAVGIAYDTASLRPVLVEARGRLLDLQGEYNALFATSAKVPSWETAYEIDKTARKAAELSDIEGFYRAFGLNVSAPVEPDSLVAELEFLALLLQKKLYAQTAGNGEGVEVCDDAYRKFLTDHLGRWYEAFLGRLNDAAEEDYYRQIGGLLQTFLEQETSKLPGSRARPLTRYTMESVQGCSWQCEG